MNDPLYISLLSSVVGALVGSVVTLLGANYFLYASKRPKCKEILIQAIKRNIDYFDPEPGTSVHGQIEAISFDDFHDFLETKWPWQKRKYLNLWKSYQNPKSRIDKISTLRDFLIKVNK